MECTCGRWLLWPVISVLFCVFRWALFKFSWWNPFSFLSQCLPMVWMKLIPPSILEGDFSLILLSSPSEWFRGEHKHRPDSMRVNSRLPLKPLGKRNSLSSHWHCWAEKSINLEWLEGICHYKGEPEVKWKSLSHDQLCNPCIVHGIL